jgi:predicted RNA binding protein YcfA (HicA-like mRNA interferase family)
MSQWSSAKAKRVLAALLRLGWRVKRESSSHKILSRPGWPDVVFAFHDKDEIGPKMLARIAKHTGLRPEDLQSSANSLTVGLLPRQIRWNPFRISCVANLKITGLPCGQVVGEEVRSRRSISQRIFSGASGMFTLMAA